MIYILGLITFLAHSAYALSSCANVDQFESRHRADVALFIKNGGCIRTTDKKMTESGRFYLIEQLPKVTSEKYQTPFLAFLNDSESHRLLERKIKGKAIQFALSDGFHVGTTALTMPADDKFAQSFRTAFGIKAQKAPLITFNPYIPGFTGDNGSSVIAHEIQHATDISNGDWKKVKDTLQKYLPAFQSLPESEGRTTLQAVFNVMIETKPYVVQYEHLKAHAPEFLKQNNLKLFLQDKMIAYVTQLGELLNKENDKTLSRSVCSAIKESAPEFFTIPYFEFYYGHSCEPDRKDTVVLSTVLCEPEFAEYPVKVRFPFRGNIEQFGGFRESSSKTPLKPTSMQTLKNYFSTHRFYKVGDNFAIPGTLCKLEVNKVIPPPTTDTKSNVPSKSSGTNR